jgi:hypothetical protein
MRVSLSAGTGYCLPWIRYDVTLEKTESWKDAVVKFENTSGLKKSGYLELIFEGAYRAGDVVEFKRISLERGDWPAGEFSIIRPGSRIFFSKLPNQTLSYEFSPNQESKIAPNISLRLVDSAGREVRSDKHSQCQYRLVTGFVLSDVPPGDYMLICEAQEIKLRQEFEFMKVEGGDHGAVVDRGIPRLDGEPFFIQGLLSREPGGARHHQS